MSHLGDIVAMKNEQLTQQDRLTTNVSEILRYFGVQLLMSRYEFGSRRDLWLIKPK